MEERGQLKRALTEAGAGAIAGAISRMVTSPLDVIKIRFQVQLEPTSSWTLLQRELYKPSKYTGILQAARDIYREEGLPGFWRGNVPALLMYMPYTAIQFMVLHKLKSFVAGSSKTGFEGDGVGGRLPWLFQRTTLTSTTFLSSNPCLLIHPEVSQRPSSSLSTSPVSSPKQWNLIVFESALVFHKLMFCGHLRFARQGQV